MKDHGTIKRPRYEQFSLRIQETSNLRLTNVKNDTSNMDGETGLKQKFVFKNDIDRDQIHHLQG